MKMAVQTESKLVGVFVTVRERAAGVHHPVAVAAELFGWTKAREDGPDWFDGFFGHRILFRPHTIVGGMSSE